VSGEVLSPYRQGYTAGCEAARSVMATWTVWNPGSMSVPLDKIERLHWMQGYAAGVKHVASTIAPTLGVPGTP
jgi:hypothetical protein